MGISKVGQEEHEGLKGSLGEKLFDAGAFEVVQECIFVVIFIVGFW